MKNIIFLLLGITLFASCQKEDDNGDLGGNWKLQQIENFKDGKVIDKKNEDRFWAIQLNLIQIGNGKGRFQHTGDSLFVQMIHETIKPEDYGLYDQKNARYGVEHLSRKSMILCSKESRLKFRKF